LCSFNLIFEIDNKILACDECSGGSNTNCTKFASPYYLSGYECVNPCPVSEFGVTSPERECSSCFNTCLTCSGSANNDCNTCNTGLFYH